MVISCQFPHGSIDHQLCAIHSVTSGPWIHSFFVGRILPPKSKPPARCKMDAEYQLVNSKPVFSSQVSRILLYDEILTFSPRIPINHKDLKETLNSSCGLEHDQCIMYTYVPGSELPLFPYNRGWSSTQ